VSGRRLAFQINRSAELALGRRRYDQQLRYYGTAPAPEIERV
jgi:hypothetical protein